MPRRMFGIARLKHLISRPRVFIPAAEGFQIHRTEFPLAKRIFHSGLEAPLLLLLPNFEPIFDEDNPGIDYVLLNCGAKFKELAVLLRSAESHHIFDAGPVVPTPIEDHNLTRGGKMRNVALHVHLTLLAIRRGW